MNPTVRILVPLGIREQGYAVLELPRRSVAMSLFNDTTIPYDGSPKTLRIDEAWANGDDVELIVRRIPALACEVCGRSLKGVRAGPVSPGGTFTYYNRTCLETSSVSPPTTC